MNIINAYYYFHYTLSYNTKCLQRSSFIRRIWRHFNIARLWAIVLFLSECNISPTNGFFIFLFYFQYLRSIFSRLFRVRVYLRGTYVQWFTGSLRISDVVGQRRREREKIRLFAFKGEESLGIRGYGDILSWGLRLQVIPSYNSPVLLCMIRAPSACIQDVPQDPMFSNA